MSTVKATFIVDSEEDSARLCSALVKCGWFVDMYGNAHSKSEHITATKRSSELPVTIDLRPLTDAYGTLKIFRIEVI